MKTSFAAGYALEVKATHYYNFHMGISRRFIAGFVASICIVLLSFAVSSATAKSARNLDIAVNVPDVVKIKKNSCSTFNVSYEVGLNAKNKKFVVYYLLLARGSTEQSDPSAAFQWNYNAFTDNPVLHSSNDRPAKGILKIRFCDNDWIWRGDQAMLGVDPGIYELGVVSETSGSQKSLFFKVRFTY